MRISKEKIRKELENKEELLRCAGEFNLVGDPTRLKICYLLCHYDRLSVSEIAELVGVSVSAVSHTLKKLQQANIVGNNREFRTVYYQLKNTQFVRMLRKRITNYEKA